MKNFPVRAPEGRSPAAGAIERITLLAAAYARRHGDYLGQASGWSEDKWSRHALSEWNLPQPISRRDVLEITANVKSPEDAEKAFIAVMVWGYGPTGYGPHRVDEMRASRRGGLGSYMLEVVEAASNGPVEAYRYMANNKIKQLGPSYGSKVAYFVTPSEVSPVLDYEVAQWIRAHEGCLRFDSRQWSTTQYEQFQLYCSQLLDVVRPLVDEREQTLGLVEYLMFIDRSARSLPKWATTI